VDEGKCYLPVLYAEQNFCGRQEKKIGPQAININIEQDLKLSRG
jgi:hypothetical protein